MIPQAKALATKSDHWSLVPRTYLVKEKNTAHKLSFDLHMYHGACTQHINKRKFYITHKITRGSSHSTSGQISKELKAKKHKYLFTHAHSNITYNSQQATQVSARKRKYGFSICWNSTQP